jgi:hypothetical protein
LLAVSWFWLSDVSVGSSGLLLVVMCGLSSIDCISSLSVVVVVGSWLSALRCRLLVVDCLLKIPLSFSIVSAQLCLILISTSSWPSLFSW